MAKQRFLTGITTTGTPHLGNYVGAIRPAIEASRRDDTENFYFLADYHALIKCHDPAQVMQSRLEIAATWLALGLDPERAVFYRQSDIPEIMELTWLLTCMTAKGLMNRAHAYKAVVQENVDSGAADPDKGITMGLFSYPVLMAADILMFKATHVPVGRDQVQHLEMTRDIAQRFNHHFKELLVLPEVVVSEDDAVLTGLDGRKMSKSYGNTIPLFEPSKKLRKLVMKIVTNSQEPGEPKDPEGNSLFEIYRAFANVEETQQMEQDFRAGIGWGDAKQRLYEKLEDTLAEPRERYLELMDKPAEIEEIMQAGALRARAHSTPLIEAMREAVGIANFR
ncbi:MAG: tryptophan--tRNA ligase [Granulosicoccaceae bacterium]